ncbi:MAG: 4-hydroxybenzoate solanesyltransferase [Cyanobacteria bacterium P01_A01_bin.3]
MNSTLLAIVHLLRWDKPAGRLILMVPALWGAVLAARGTPPVSLIAIIIVGTLATSAAGCVVNDIWDRNLDDRVERTKTRPLASKRLSLTVGAVVGVVGLMCAFVLATFLNPVTFGLCAAAVPVIALYPGAKRVFPVPQLVLGIAWGFAVLICWTAVTGQLDDRPIWEPALFFLWAATVLWTLGFDTVYALSDREDDEKVGIKSSARFFGPLAPTAIGLFFVGAAIFLLCTGLLLNLSLAYYLALLAACGVWAWQTKKLHEQQPSKTLFPKIFRQNVTVGFVLLAGMIAGSLL